MDLAIVIVSFNTRQLTRDCLASVYADLARSGLKGHVWVVDNASADGSAAMVAEEYPQATLIASDSNLGFACGVNLGLERVLAADQRPPYVLLLNPDTLVRSGALERMVQFLREQPRVGVVGARLSYGDGSFQHGAFRFPTLAMAFFDFWPVNHRLLDSRLNGRYPRRLYEAGEPFPIDHPLGAAMMVRREVVETVGLLDAGYFMYCEEIDWCLRIKRAGWEIYCVPRAEIVHLEGQSTRQFRDEMYVALWRSRYRLFEQHYDRVYRFLVRRIVRAGLRRAIRQLTGAAERGDIIEEERDRRLAACRAVMEM